MAEAVARHRCFGGTVTIWAHDADATSCRMRLSAFVPDGPGPFPVLVWLSGLTCTEDNFTVKAGAYRRAAALKMIVVASDTSPRGEGTPDDPAYDLGQGASFYVDATEAPWSERFRMRTYIVDELPALIQRILPADPGRMGISGHSMGGHGALTLGLRYPERFRSISAFAPISNPTECPWGHKALTAYLGPDRAAWAEHDAVRILRSSPAAPDAPPILVDQGTADPFLAEQLHPDRLEAAAAAAGRRLVLRRQEGYDHSYFFVSSFIDDHLDHHARIL